MKKYSYLITILALIPFLAGCAANNQNQDISKLYKFGINIDEDIYKESKRNNFSIHEKPKQEKTTLKQEEDNTTKAEPAFMVYKFPKADSSSSGAKVKEEKNFTINVNQIPINKFSKLVFGQILELNYTIDNAMEMSKKKVTLQIQKPVTKDELYTIAEKILENNGFLIEQIENYYNIKKGKSKVSRNTYGTNFYYGREIDFSNLYDSDEITIFIPYFYTDLSKMRNLFLRYYLSPRESLIDVIKHDNILIVKDKVKNIKNLLVFIDTLDTSAMKDKFTKLLYLDYIESKSFTERIIRVLPTVGIPIATNLKQMGIIIEEIPEINAMLLVADKKEWIDSVVFWKNRLDVLDLNDDERRVYIYKPKNRKSDELKKLVEQLFSGDNLPLTTNTQNNTNNKADKNGAKKNTTVKTNAANRTLSKLKVIEDSSRNALIVYATSFEYRQILNMLEKLDVLPKQVLIEVTLAELTLTDKLQYGLEWYLRNEGSKFTTEIGTMGTLGLGGSGLVGSAIKLNNNFNALLNAFAQKNLINILSSPKLVVLDNQSASINVGTDVPILTSSSTLESTAADQKTTQSYEYRKTGIILDVKPTIHSEGTLTLEITQTTSEAQQNNTSSISSPLILNRSIQTSVVLKSNQALLLGGLIEENKSDTITKVPMLGDIPVMGNLFKTNSDSIDKTELMVIVKPIIMNNIEKTKSITEGMMRLMSKTY